MMTTAESIDLRVPDVRRRRVEEEEQHVVTVESEAGDVVPIWVGPSEAIALALRLSETPTPRPLTYDTMARTTRDLLDDVAEGPRAFAYSEDDFPDDAAVIASEIKRQWTPRRVERGGDGQEAWEWFSACTASRPVTTAAGDG